MSELLLRRLLLILFLVFRRCMTRILCVSRTSLGLVRRILLGFD